MQRLTENVIAAKMISTVVLAGALLLAGCAASMNSSSSSSLSAPVFTPAGGTFSSSQTVTVSDAMPGAVLYCTTDGSTPSKSSPVCPEPVTVYKSETLNAIAVAPDGTASSPASASYTITLPTAAAPTISPSGGTFTTVQTVTLSDTTAGATIYYTTDGTTPTTASNVYGGTITVSANETINAVAISAATTISPVATASFVINLPAATPMISPSGGTFTSIQTATITDATAGATIYYTLDGSTPTVSSAVYGGPITVSKSETIQAIALAPGSSVSAVASAAFTLNLTAATPVISPAGGTYTSIQTVSISDTTPGATIYYTLDGSAPTTASTPYSGTISVSKSETISAIAAATGYANSAVATAAYTVNLPPAPLPVFNPAAGTYTTIQNVSISESAAGASIYYTTDGSTPTTSSTQYTAPISVAATQTIKAIATATGYVTSAVASSTYTINFPPAATPVISPTGGTFSSTQTVTITDSTPGATIYYTTNGSTPTTSSTPYTAAISVSATETIKAIAAASGFTASPVATAVYTFVQPAAATPVISPAGGTFTSPQTVTITDTTTGSAIYYTTDGSVPSTLSTKYTAPITVSATETIKVIASASGFNDSPVATASFTINQTAATPVISPAGGTFSSAQTVTLTDATSGASIYYTTDGSTPSSSSTAYTTPFTVSATETVKAIAVATGFTNSAVASASFTINLAAAATPAISPAGGTFTSAQPVTLTDATAGAAIYYTTDGSTPTTSSTMYTASFTVSTTETVKAIATASGYSTSAVASATFTINQVVGIPLSGTVSTGSTPITGAQVQLYAAGTTGYGSAPTALLATAVTTDSTGAFSLGYTCPAAPGDQVYLVATGGSVAGTANSDSALMLALGTCTKLTSGETVTINEVTTISSAYALSAFAKNDSGGGIDIGAPAPSATCVSTGAETCNYMGMANAFKTVANLVDAGSGAALTITPFYASAPVTALNTSTAPQARINTLADILQSCVAPAAAGSCTALFTAATPTGGTAPVDTLQAALAIAQNPGNSVATLYGLLASSPPYTPNLSAAPNDFALAITYTGGGLGLPYSFTSGSMANTSMDIDSAGNIYVTAYESKHISSNGILAIFNSSGEASTPATTSTTNIGGFLLSDPPNNYDGPLSIALDQSKNIWIDNFGDLRELTPDLNFTTVIGPSSNPLHVTGNITIDLNGNIWAANGTNIVEVSNSGTLVSPTGSGWNGVSSADSSGFSDVQHLIFDSTGNTLWAADNNGSNSVYQIDPSDGKILVNYFPPNGNPVGVTTPLVADGSGNIYGCPVSSTPTLDTFNATSTSVVASNTIGNSRGCGTGPMVIDGAGHIFAANFNSAGTAAILDEFSTTGTALSPAEGFSATSDEESVVLNKAATQKAMSVDGSGNIWVLNGNTGNASVVGNALVQIIGLAAPVVTPNSVALTNGELATRP